MNEWVLGLQEGTTHRRTEEKRNVGRHIDSPCGSSSQCYKTLKLAKLILELVTSTQFY